MRCTVLLIFVGCTLLAGCGSSGRSTSPVASELLDGGSANLALGPSYEHVRIGTRATARSDWPAVSIGYRLDDITRYYSVLYDRESQYDRFGGVFHGTETIQSGVWLR